MADPVIIECPAGVWTLVASNVTAGRIKMASTAPNQYLETYRMTGNPAPTDQSEGVPAFPDDGATAEILSAAPIDVYIMAVGKDGKVRADL
jgi:hypothetical protein